ncbi:glycoside hydrolase family 18 protein [Apiospora saccharicola]|uniref:chitinase n=1 Tax=Apiospora saccharicola TaxID=335842 RepID=A0ABR1V996_9PEZI
MQVLLLFTLFFLLAHHGYSQASGPGGNSSRPLKPGNSSTLPATSNRSAPLPRNSSSTIKALYQAYSDKTPKFQNQPLIQFLSDHPDARLDRMSPNSLSLLEKRQSNGLPEGVCAPGQPCTNGACCSNTGVCSYAPSSCAPDVCISNCDAKAPCGQYADPASASCPLNVCCSQYGFCGSESDFCGDGCQEGFGSCGPAPRPSCATSGGAVGERRIGYYASWSTTKSCDAVPPEDLDVSSLTHVIFSFAFFDPSTFQITPMDANAGTLLSRFTALKRRKPGLETWIAIGGWSFNDAGNVPDTRQAFSNMAGSAANRRVFIRNLLNFMQTYGFDGVDLDWEYPGAEDRGGVAADKANFPILLSEMRAALGGRGISVTLPSSFWYLQNFDPPAMARSIDWFNVMSYDIHGVWDSANRFTGPFIRPHTNLTEIDNGLDLLWRAGVSPEQVTLGLGWYGRSFTLADPSCGVPDGVCRFTAGANPGECSNNAGTLTNAEIKRILASGVATESYDEEAGVKWMQWDSNQWVSYDDGVTMQQKMNLANQRCLGGVMIWSIDQDNTGASMDDMLGIGDANSVPDAIKKGYKDMAAAATRRKAVADSCYWSLCGGQCTDGYFDVTESRGSPSAAQRNAICGPGEVQTLCCAPGTTMGQCRWEGFRGVGFPCSPACSDRNATLVARNTNSYHTNQDGQIRDLTCIGGYQAFCCSGFEPSPITNTGNLNLIGQGDMGGGGRRSLSRETSLVAVRDEHGGSSLETTIALCAALGALGALETLGFALLAGGVCAAAAIAVKAIGFIAGLVGDFAYGQWALLDFNNGGGGGGTTSSCDCVVTYTCRYGLGWDEVCDNQRWAVNKVLGGHTVFQPDAQRPAGRRYSAWANNQRAAEFRTLAQRREVRNVYRCQLDEFPMGDLEESGGGQPQACRLVNGPANAAQGGDYSAWKRAQWRPCSSYRRTECNIQDRGPPATWKFGPLNGNRGGGNGKHFLNAYGFDSQTPNSACFATYKYNQQGGTEATSTPVDHGFRVLDDDPMYGQAYGWPRQNWRDDPRPVGGNRPYNIQPGVFQKREQERMAAATGNITEDVRSVEEDVCHAKQAPRRQQQQQGGGPDFTHDGQQFVDMEGHPIDGRNCDIIYDDDDDEDDPESRTRIVIDEDGGVVGMYVEDADEGMWARGGAWADSSAYDIPVTLVTTATTIQPSARPGSGEASFTIPTSTTMTRRRMKTVVTMAPAV